MQFSREASLAINFVLNELMPPILRDSRIVMWLAMKMAFGKKAKIFFEFRNRLSTMTNTEFVAAYKETADCNLIRGSDLNQKCKTAIKENIVGNTVLDVGCGRGELLSLLSDYETVGCDINPTLTSPNRVVKAFAESLPFQHNSFDTVVCTHVLEHVRDLPAAVNELRRVASSRLLIVVPRERPYKFGFNLHVSFFPYRYSLFSELGAAVDPAKIHVSNLGGDWFYIEDLENPSA